MDDLSDQIEYPSHTAKSLRQVFWKINKVEQILEPAFTRDKFQSFEAFS
jgi:hypothetical protein